MVLIISRPAEPFHEVITPWQQDFQGTIGRNHAKYFDEHGWLYYTREEYDLFYPSYDTWPLYNGAIGMTYEQAGHGAAGLAVINSEGDTLSLYDRAIHHSRHPPVRSRFINERGKAR